MMYAAYVVCRLMKNTQKMAPLPSTGLTAVKLNHKVVDFRKEKAIIRDLAYLTGEAVAINHQPVRLIFKEF